MSASPATARRFSLHHLTALDAEPAELIAIAGRLGLDHVCLFTHVPEQARKVYKCVAPADVAPVAAALKEARVTLCNIEVFPLDRDGGLERFREGLETGAALGAARATAHIHDADFSAAVARFAAFAELAAEHDIVAGLEFNAFSAVKDAPAAARIVRAAGIGSVVLDALHLKRSGGGIAEVEAIADLVGYAQLSDGPETIAEDKRWREAVAERLLPGEGAFALADLLRPLSGDTVFEIEVPQSAAMKQGVDASERARRATDAARALFSLSPVGTPSALTP